MAMNDEGRKIAEKKLKRYQANHKKLGRHVEHDPRSHEYPLPRRAAPRSNVQHPTYGDVLNQGNIGACTGFAAAHILNTGPLLRAALVAKKLPLRTTADAKEYYHLATALDAWPGVWPPSDTGSSGLAVAKALKKLGLIKSYQWAFGVDGVLGAIASGSLLVGTPWYENFFYPDKDGLVKIGGRIAGGHEYVVTGYQIVNRTSISQNLFWCRNSWGIRWGKIGGFCMTVKTMERLLAQNGDALYLSA